MNTVLLLLAYVFSLINALPVGAVAPIPGSRMAASGTRAGPNAEAVGATFQEAHESLFPAVPRNWVQPIMQFLNPSAIDPSAINTPHQDVDLTDPQIVAAFNVFYRYAYVPENIGTIEDNDYIADNKDAILMDIAEETKRVRTETRKQIRDRAMELIEIAFSRPHKGRRKELAQTALLIQDLLTDKRAVPYIDDAYSTSPLSLRPLLTRAQALAGNGAIQNNVIPSERDATEGILSTAEALTIDTPTRAEDPTLVLALKRPAAAETAATHIRSWAQTHNTMQRARTIIIDELSRSKRYTERVQDRLDKLGWLVQEPDADEDVQRYIAQSLVAELGTKNDYDYDAYVLEMLEDIAMNTRFPHVRKIIIDGVANYAAENAAHPAAIYAVDTVEFIMRGALSLDTLKHQVALADFKQKALAKLQQTLGATQDRNLQTVIRRVVDNISRFMEMPLPRPTNTLERPRSGGLGAFLVLLFITGAFVLSLVYLLHLYR